MANPLTTIFETLKTTIYETIIISKPRECPSPAEAPPPTPPALPAPRTCDPPCIPLTAASTVFKPYTPHPIAPTYPQPPLESLDDIPPTSFLPVIILGTAVLLFLTFYCYPTKLYSTRLKAHQYKFLWDTSDWRILVGLTELSLFNLLPWTPFFPPNPPSATHWPDKSYLQRLLRRGIIPLELQDGGVSTQRASPPSYALNLGLATLHIPRWLQSKKRAYFTFLVPYPEGYDRAPLPLHDSGRRTFIDALLNDAEKRYGAVVRHLGRRTVQSRPGPPHLALEVGAEAPLEVLLPFLPDRVVRMGLGGEVGPVGECVREGVGVPPLLERGEVAVVRVEARHFGKKRLDEWVYGLVEKVPLIWTGGEIAEATGQWLERNGVEMPDGGWGVLSREFYGINGAGVSKEDAYM
ncbi:hypothetical protein BS50DRAFT_643853 [Corynespora cassiicola Philippines]|uniref:Uncharacterized protein n=1 Tax=Corynespora cassiicola Philippines TaxID=1448308 RepID=A0A2T2PC05_CORCC|nr:hypothetical protein BS50DRAFT_643853 [Corynespora cassiicola Philippines]